MDAKITDRILFIDDDPGIRDSIQRQLRGKFSIETAADGRQGLADLRKNGPYAAMVADLHLPGLDGIQTLASAKVIAPDTVRLLLTGEADLKTALEAVEKGGVFRILLKPCSPSSLAGALEDALKQHRLIKSQANEARFHTLAQVSPVGIFRTDASGQFVYVNERWCEMAGLNIAEALGEGWRRGIHPDDREALFGSWSQAVREKRPFKAEYRFQRPDGQVTWVLGQAVAETSLPGEVDGYVGTITDITDRKEAETELLKAKNAAEASHELQTRFLANMTHELRTPLTAILGYCNLIKPQMADPKAIQNLSIIKKSGQHLLELIDDLLDLSRIEAGQLEIKSVPCSPLRVLAEVCKVLGLQALEKRIKLSARLETPIPEFIFSDPVRLRQALINLVGNAIKFTEGGSVEISVQHSPGKEGPGFLEYQIKDQGIGIPEDRLDRLFKPFSQLDPSASRKYGGTGLGLSISMRIAQLLGGYLKVQSKLGRGSTFTLGIRGEAPLEVHRVTDFNLEETEPEILDQPWQFPSPLGHILLIVDACSECNLLCPHLSSFGIKVAANRNVASALKNCQENKFDLILLDVENPVLAGRRISEFLHQNGMTIPIILLMGEAGLENDGDPSSAGFTAVLKKPVSPAELLDCVSAFLKGSRREIFSRHALER